MQQVSWRGYFALQQGRQMLAQRLQAKMADERGEIGSWLILAAGLAIAAGLAVVALGPWIAGKVTDITNN